MKCGRCGADTRVVHHEVDGYTGRLCERCREAWERLRASG